MANTIKLKSSAVPGKVPTTSDLELRELGINTYDGKLFLKKDDGTASIVEIGAGGGGGTAGPIPQYDPVIGENVTLTSGYNGFSFETVEVGNGYSVEVPAGQSWAIIDDNAPIRYNSSLKNLSAPLNALEINFNSSGYYNTAFGDAALKANSIGYLNTAIGTLALTANTGGFSNTAVGYGGLYSNTEGQHNVALGKQALYTNTIGDRNVCLGSEAGLLINGNASVPEAGSNNVAIGYRAMRFSTSCDRNVAIGEETLLVTTTGYWNTAVGARSGISNTEGFMNTAIGFESFFYNQTGDYNTALGFRALNQGTNNSNTCIGAEAGYYITSGANNTCIGLQAGADAVANLTTASNYVVLGNNSTANANIKVSWTVTSDARDKCNIAPCTSGLAFVSSLKPVRYQYRKHRDSDEPATSSRPRYGFLAQDILALEGSDPVIIDDRDPDSLKFNEASLLPVLVNAIQELSAQVGALTARVQALEAN